MPEFTPERREHCDLKHFDRYMDKTTKKDTLPALLTRRITWIAQYTEDLKILDLGCGYGHWIKKLLENIADNPSCRHLKSIDYVGIDKQEEAFTTIEGTLKKIEFKYSESKYKGFFSYSLPKTFDLNKYLKPKGTTEKEHLKTLPKQLQGKDKGKYDLILCSHVLYYVSEWKDFISRLTSKLLTDEGELCLILAANGKLTGDINEQYWSLNEQETDCKEYAPQVTRPTVHQMKSWLTHNLDLSYKYDIHEYLLKILDLKSSQELSQDLIRKFNFYQIADAYSFLVGVDSQKNTDIEGVDSKKIQKDKRDYYKIAKIIGSKPLAEHIYWIRSQKSSSPERIKVRAFHISDDVQRCIQGIDYDKKEEKFKTALRHENNITNSVCDRIEKQHEERSRLTHDFHKRGKAEFNTLELMLAYYTCDPIRLDLSERFGYLAGAVIGWRNDGSLFMPATDISLGSEVVRQPICPKEGLKGLHKSFSILLDDLEISNKIANLKRPKKEITNLEDPKKETIILKHPKIKKCFPRATKELFEACIRAELKLVQCGGTKIDKVIDFFYTWLGDDNFNKKCAEEFIEIMYNSKDEGPGEIKNISKDEEPGTSGLRIFWELAFGVFLCLLDRCGSKISRPAPYCYDDEYFSDNDDDGYANNWVEDIACNYVPYAKVLSVYIDIVIFFAWDAKDEQDKDKKLLKKDCFKILNNIGALTGDHFTNRLAEEHYPYFGKNFKNQKLWSDLAGTEFGEWFDKIEQGIAKGIEKGNTRKYLKPRILKKWDKEMKLDDALDDLYKVAGFGLHNIYTYLYSDTVSTGQKSILYPKIECRISLIRRGILWYKAHSSISSSEANALEVKEMFFVANVDESVCFPYTCINKKPDDLSKHAVKNFENVLFHRHVENIVRLMSEKNMFSETISVTNSRYYTTQLQKKGLEAGIHSFMHTLKSRLYSIFSTCEREGDMEAIEAINTIRRISLSLYNQVNSICLLDREAGGVAVESMKPEELNEWYKENLDKEWKLICLSAPGMPSAEDIFLPIGKDFDEGSPFETVKDVLYTIFYEILDNLMRHAICEDKISIKYDRHKIMTRRGEINEQVCMIVENTSDRPLDIETLMERRGDLRIRGLGVIERMQHYLNPGKLIDDIPFWMAEKVNLQDEKNNRIRFYYPIEFNRKGGHRD